MYKVFKRFCNFLISGLGLIILSPVFLVLAIMSKIFIGDGPIILKQARVGKGGRIFMYYKFRSMTNAKDKDGNLLPDDVRLTKFGKLLRTTSLDELPQLWNIFKGDMNLIGPRPQMIENDIFYSKQVYKALDTTPGITGYSQVNGRNGVSWTTRLKQDMYYVEHESLWLDIKIFFKTIAVVFEKSNIVKEQYLRYGDELLDKGLITENEHKAYKLKSRELEARCGLGEKLNIKDFALNNDRDMPVVSDVKEYNDKVA